MPFFALALAAFTLSFSGFAQQEDSPSDTFHRAIYRLGEAESRGAQYFLRTLTLKKDIADLKAAARKDKLDMDKFEAAIGKAFTYVDTFLGKDGLAATVEERPTPLSKTTIRAFANRYVRTLENPGRTKLFLVEDMKGHRIRFTLSKGKKADVFGSASQWKELLTLLSEDPADFLEKAEADRHFQFAVVDASDLDWCMKTMFPEAYLNAVEATITDALKAYEHMKGCVVLKNAFMKNFESAAKLISSTERAPAKASAEEQKMLAANQKEQAAYLQCLDASPLKTEKDFERDHAWQW